MAGVHSTGASRIGPMMTIGSIRNNESRRRRSCCLVPVVMHWVRQHHEALAATARIDVLSAPLCAKSSRALDWDCSLIQAAGGTPGRLRLLSRRHAANPSPQCHRRQTQRRDKHDDDVAHRITGPAPDAHPPVVAPRGARSSRHRVTVHSSHVGISARGTMMPASSNCSTITSRDELYGLKFGAGEGTTQ